MFMCFVWLETDSPRKMIASSGVETRIGALGTRFVAIFRLSNTFGAQTSPVLPPPPLTLPESLGTQVDVDGIDVYGANTVAFLLRSQINNY